MNLQPDVSSQPQEPALSSSPGWSRFSNEVSKLIDDVPRAISAPPHLQDRWAVNNATDPVGVPQQWTSVDTTDIRYDEDYPKFYEAMVQHFNGKLPRPVENHTLYDYNLLNANELQNQQNAAFQRNANAHRQQMMLRGGLESIQETPGAAEVLHALQQLQLQQAGTPPPMSVTPQILPSSGTSPAGSKSTTPAPFDLGPHASPSPLLFPGQGPHDANALLQAQAMHHFLAQQQQQQHPQVGLPPPNLPPAHAAAALVNAAAQGANLSGLGAQESYQAAYAAAIQAVALQQQHHHQSLLAGQALGANVNFPPHFQTPGAPPNIMQQLAAASAGQLGGVPNPFYNGTAAAAAAAAAAVTAATAAAANSLAGRVPFPQQAPPAASDRGHQDHHDHHKGGSGGGMNNTGSSGNLRGDRRHRLGRRGGDRDNERGGGGFRDRDRDKENETQPPVNGIAEDHGVHGKYENLEEVVGQLLAVAQDQNGCRFLQRKFDEGGPTAVAVVFKELLESMVTLMKDPFGNYLIQKLLDRCSEDQRLQVLKSVASKGDLVAVALNTHGTRAVQKLIETLHGREQRQIVIEALRGGVTALIKDLNGNHVVQRCLQRLGPEDSQFIYDAACANCVEIATHRHGCCVLQRCVDFATPPQKRRLVDEIAAHALPLSQDAFGNYVVQYVLELGESTACATVMRQLLGHYGELSMQKFSSNVVERCLKLSNLHKERQAIVQELTTSPQLPRLLQDSYGNYVVQSALTVAQGATHAALVEAIKPFATSLRGTPHGKRILQKIHGK